MRVVLGSLLRSTFVLSMLLGAAAGFTVKPGLVDARADELCDTYQPYCLQQAGCEHGCIDIPCENEDCPRYLENDTRRCYTCWIPG